MGFSWIDGSVLGFLPNIEGVYHRRPPDRGDVGLKAPNIGEVEVWVVLEVRMEVREY